MGKEIINFTRGEGLYPATARDYRGLKISDHLSIAKAISDLVLAEESRKRLVTKLTGLREGVFNESPQENFLKRFVTRVRSSGDIIELSEPNKHYTIIPEGISASHRELDEPASKDNGTVLFDGEIYFPEVYDSSKQFAD